jgi:Icc protein
VRIAHISDLHVSSNYYVKELGDRLRDSIHKAGPDLLIISGDLTDWGYPFEYDIAREFVDSLGVDKRVIVPGNHDARNLGYEIFEEVFGTRNPCYEDEEVVVLGLDSAEPDIDDGHIGRESYPLIEQRMARKGKVRVVTMHHHLIPIPGTGRERHIPADAGDVLRACGDAGVDLILSGHKHLPWIWGLDDMYLVTAGTACTRKLKGRSFASYNIMDIHGEKLTINRVNVPTGEWDEVLSTDIKLD